MTAKYGTPYFSNYINSDMEPSDVRSMCCRLRLDLRELRRKTGGFFGSGESTGSVGVVTINLPRIAYLAKDEKDFYSRLDHMMDLSARSLKIKRDVITKLLDGGLYPYTKRYLGSFDNHFSTIGLIGMNEAGLNACWLRKDLTHEETQKFAKDVLNHMRERLVKYQEEYGDLYNLEATPAESTTYRLAKHDKERWPDIITADECQVGEGTKKSSGKPYYTNSSHLPVGYTSDIFDALDVQDELQTLYTSGTVFHAFLGERLPDWKSAAVLVRRIAENYKLPYYTISPTYSVCREHGYLSGEQYVCPICGAKTEVYSRITGYYRPVQNWNDGKAEEFKDRRLYDIGSSFEHRADQPGFSAGYMDDADRTITAESAARVSVTEHEVDAFEICGGETADQGTVHSAVADDPSVTMLDVDPHQTVRYLFTTSTCPNCKIARKMLGDEPYTLIDADENQDLVRRFGIMQAPTLVVMHNGEVDKYVNASNIKKYVNARI
jgi:ribonucleoside-triphosphate reductase